jgi:hypothetical protein
VAVNLSQNNELVGVVMHDLFVALEQENVIVGLVHSILDDVIDLTVEFHEEEKGPYGELGFMIPSSWLLEEPGLMARVEREAGEHNN